MKKIFFGIGSFLLFIGNVSAQEDVYPAKDEKAHTFIINGTVHVGNGQVINNGTVEIKDGKIVQAGENVAVNQQGAKVIDAKGKQVYPGLILPVTDLGLKEIGGNRGANDFLELGEFNPNVRSIVAYNTDSKIINTLKSNGILLACVTPAGGTISGTSSVVQLDAWNWEDAAYKMDNGLHMDMPSLIVRSGRRFGGGGGPAGAPATPADQLREALAKIEGVKDFFREAKAYLAEPSHKQTNLKFESLAKLFNKEQKLFVHCDQVKQMLIAIDFAKEFGFDVVIIGGSESWQIADLLKQSNIAVILQQEHSLPSTDDDDIDQPYKTPAALYKAGVLFALNDEDGTSRYRNLPFNAGTAAAYGLGKEPALQAITLNTAKILGIADKTGSIEVGKDANIIISEGDILDMRTSIIIYAFIQGRMVDLNNKQKQLYERYKHKYELKPF